MAKREVVFFKHGDGSPLLEWLEVQPQKLKIKCLDRLMLLEERWDHLHRPHADHLGEGIYELRIAFQGDQYRILYFFDGKTIVVATHAFLKNRSRVPEKEIKRAKEYRDNYLADREAHTLVTKT